MSVAKLLAAASAITAAPDANPELNKAVEELNDAFGKNASPDNEGTYVWRISSPKSKNEIVVSLNMSGKNISAECYIQTDKGEYLAELNAKDSTGLGILTKIEKMIKDYLEGPKSEVRIFGEVLAKLK